MEKRIYYLVFIVLIISLNSCKEKEYYELALDFYNASNSILTVQVFPKKPYIIEPYYDFYNIYIDDTTKTGGAATKVNADPGYNTRSILVTGYIESDPIELINQVFDSIYCSFEGDSPEVIKFYPDSVKNYPFNCFSYREFWILCSTNYRAPCTMVCPNERYYVTIYKFPINDSLIIRNEY